MKEVRIYHVRAGIEQRLTKSTEKKITEALSRRNGKLAWVADKCVAFEFETDQAAQGFARDARALGADVEVME